MGAFTQRAALVISIPPATTLELGGIKVGSGLSIDSAGVLSTTAASSGNILSKIAGAALGGHRIVYIDSAGKAQYASNQILSDSVRTLGMTLGAAILDAAIDIQTFGEITESSWTWTLGQSIYLGVDGLLTQTPPTSPALFQRVVGFPLSATSIFLSMRDPIVLSS